MVLYCEGEMNVMSRERLVSSGNESSSDNGREL